MSAMLIYYACHFTLLCLAASLICITLRLFKGPYAKDRLVAFDALYISSMLIALVLAVRSDTQVYFDLALIIAMFGFVGTCAIAKFLLRGEVMEP